MKKAILCLGSFAAGAVLGFEFLRRIMCIGVEQGVIEVHDPFGDDSDDTDPPDGGECHQHEYHGDQRSAQTDVAQSAAGHITTVEELAQLWEQSGLPSQEDIDRDMPSMMMEPCDTAESTGTVKPDEQKPDEQYLI